MKTQTILNSTALIMALVAARIEAAPFAKILSLPATTQPSTPPTTQPSNPPAQGTPAKPIRHGKLKFSIYKTVQTFKDGQPEYSNEVVCENQESALPVYDWSNGEIGNITDFGLFSCDSTLRDVGAVKVWIGGVIALYEMPSSGPSKPGISTKTFSTGFAVLPPNVDPMGDSVKTLKEGDSTFSTRTLSLDNASVFLIDSQAAQQTPKYAETFDVTIEMLDDQQISK